MTRSLRVAVGGINRISVPSARTDSRSAGPGWLERRVSLGSVLSRNPTNEQKVKASGSFVSTRCESWRRNCWSSSLLVDLSLLSVTIPLFSLVLFNFIPSLSSRNSSNARLLCSHVLRTLVRKHLKSLCDCTMMCTLCVIVRVFREHTHDCGSDGSAGCPVTEGLAVQIPLHPRCVLGQGTEPTLP